MSEERPPEGSWDEVGRQFQALGESLARTFRAAWEDEGNRQHLQEMKDGLERMAQSIGQAIDTANASPEGQQFRQEVEKAAESARVAGKQALQEARPHLISALSRVNAELDRVIRRLEEEVE
ncbi:MAG: hypothetical protein JXD18_10775 [Anaerolineae bacterium]|nr:hypothetical protein [Anaerolineae bacterium]